VAKRVEGAVAWGLIDGARYLMSCVLDRSNNSRSLESVQRASDDAEVLGNDSVLCPSLGIS